MFIATVGAIRPARAQSTAAEAERLFNEGREAMQAHDYALACDRFSQSDRLDHAVGTIFNLANCEEQRGRVFTATTLFRRVREQLSPGDRRLSIADDRLSALAPRIPHLRLIAAVKATEDVHVRIDGSELEAAAWNGSVPLDPGVHTVAFAASGQTERTKTLELRERQLLEVTIPFEEPAARGSSPPNAGLPSNDRSPRSAQAPRSSDRFLGLDRRTAAYVVGSVGVAGILTGALTGALGLHQEAVGNANCSDATRTCNEKGVDANDRARSLAAASTVGFVLGVVGVGFGSYLYLTAGPAPSAGVARNHPEGLSVTWSGRW